MDPATLLELFGDTCEAITRALAPIQGGARRARTPRRGQYQIDIVADEAALGVLAGREFAVVSEESGVTGPPRSELVVVVDPVDGSSNAVRNLPYWATSLCAVDSDGPWVAMVVNHATCEVNTAVRGEGAFRNDGRLHASTATRVEDAVVALSTFPGRVMQWKQFRAMGSCALALCDVASGAFDGYFDGGSVHAPWDYLGGLLLCTEAGGTVVDQQDRPLGLADPNVRRHLIAAGTPELVAQLRKAAG